MPGIVDCTVWAAGKSREWEAHVQPMQANGDRNVFFHWSDIRNKDFYDLSVGDGVEFVLGSNDRGPIATAIDVTAPSSRKVAEE